MQRFYNSNSQDQLELILVTGQGNRFVEIPSAMRSQVKTALAFSTEVNSGTKAVVRNTFLWVSNFISG